MTNDIENSSVFANTIYSAMNINTAHLLNESKTFCMAPWLHLYTTPVGEAFPCCIAKTKVGYTTTQPVETLINNEPMKQLRLDMLNGVRNANCQACFSHEDQGIHSFRQQFSYRYGRHINEVLNNTSADGSVQNFKMRYFDIRFSNICNFKCRTCNSHFSTQWEKEDIKRGVPGAKIHGKNNNKELLDSVLAHIPHMEYAYFAGGEPLITEEHYLLLEEMIKQGRTDIMLVYNSNISSLKFKNKDLLKIWSKFEKPIEMAASIDHIGERAEYIRNGTDWGVIETNLLKLKKSPNVKLLVNTVISAFNYVTLDEVYRFLIDKKIYDPSPGPSYSAYPLSSPEHFNSQILPKELKILGRTRNEALIDYMRSLKYDNRQTGNVKNLLSWTESVDSWEQHKENFKKEIEILDKFRGEDFVKTFPELAMMLE